MIIAAYTEKTKRIRPLRSLQLRTEHTVANYNGAHFEVSTFIEMKTKAQLTPQKHVLSSPSYILEMIMKIVFNIEVRNGEVR